MQLIVASRRQSDANGAAKREKDVYQATLLIEALEKTRRQDDLAEVFAEAWHRGPHWRKAIGKGLRVLPEIRREAALSNLGNALSSIGEDLEGFSDVAAPAKPSRSLERCIAHARARPRSTEEMVGTHRAYGIHKPILADTEAAG